MSGVVAESETILLFEAPVWANRELIELSVTVIGHALFHYIVAFSKKSEHFNKEEKKLTLSCPFITLAYVPNVDGSTKKLGTKYTAFEPVRGPRNADCQPCTTLP